MQQGTEILIGVIAILIIAIILGGIQIREMNKTLALRKRKDVPMVPEKSIHEKIEETLAERKRIIEELEKK